MKEGDDSRKEPAAYLIRGELGLGPRSEGRLGTGTRLGRGLAEIACL